MLCSGSDFFLTVVMVLLPTAAGARLVARRACLVWSFQEKLWAAMTGNRYLILRASKEGTHGNYQGYFGGAIPIKIDRDGLCCPIDGVPSLLLG